MKSKIIKRYRLEFYSHANEIIVQVDSNIWEMIETLFESQSQYYSKAVMSYRQGNKWVLSRWKVN